MILQHHPRYTRLYRNFKHSIVLKNRSNNFLRWGSLGLKVCVSGNLFYNELEAFRRSLQAVVKPFGFLYCVVPLDRCLTKKPVGSRMGHGKGAIDMWYSSVVSGMIIFEVKFVHIAGYPRVKSHMLFCKEKISLKTKIVESPYSVRKSRISLNVF